MKLKMRTLEEMKAYVEGYNACNKQFRECLENNKTVMDAVKEIDTFVATVNGIIERKDEE